ncbi:MAG: negative regulator of tic competence ClpC/MecB [Candidatus Parcubacteria bacterium]|jgi:ATP-dependent Clp protease ATP-binding subunit ClpC
MVGFFNFKKKQADPSTADMSSGSATYQQSSSVQSSSEPYNGVGQPSTGTAYNGIGGTPSGGEPYSGIGNPPSGQAYNGIGSPPPPTAAPVETTTVTQTNMPTPAQTPGQAPVQNTASVQTTTQQPGAPGAVQTISASTGSAVPPPPNAQQTAVLKSNINDQKREELDVMTHLTQRSNRVFLSANNKAKEMQNIYLDSEHILHGLLTDGEIFKMLVDFKIQPQSVEAELTKVYKKETSPTPPQIAPRVKRIIENSLIIARKLGFEFISPEHILLALYDEKEGIAAQILVKLGLKKEDLNKRILGKKEGLDKVQPAGAAQAKKTLMEQFTVDLTAKAAEGKLDPVVERSETIERVIHILSRRTKNNPALVGEAGVGKTAIVEGLAQKIVAKQVPETMMEKRILELDLMGILAGASHRGEFEERMKNLIEDLKNSQGKIILFIDEIHTIVGAGGGGEGSVDASNFLKPALARGEIQLIGATTLTEYRKYIEKDPALERRFQPVIVPEPTEEAAIKMLKSTRDKYEAFHRVKIPDDVIEAAVKLSKRYIGDRFLPDKAVDLVDESASAVRLPMLSLPEVIKSLQDRVSQLKQEQQEDLKAGEKVKAKILNSKIAGISQQLKDKQDEYNTKKGQTTTAVSVEIVKDIVSRWTGIPVNKITGSEMEKLAKLEDIMHERMIGQERAVSAVAQAVRRGRAGLKSTQRPIGSFIFLGPTGTGKTELAKTLAEVLFGQEEAMLRFDMTEYMEKHEVAKLLGAPPGYVGYEEGGKLTEAVRRKPYSVVLFDEVEKAHPDIFNILLQILDDGRLTDNKGHTISFKNTVVICTSNLGSQVIQDEMLKNGKGEVEEPPILSTYVFTPRGREILTIGSKYFLRDSGNTSTPDVTKSQTEEIKPLKLNSYAFSPRGREIATIGATYYERDAKSGIGDLTGTDKKDTAAGWNKVTLQEYFAGQKLELDSRIEMDPKEKEKLKLEFPVQGFDTQAIDTKGVETITKDSMMIYRTSTTAKVWSSVMLLDYFKDNMVINALPDAPDEQLPTAKLQTHAFSADEKEVVTYKNRFWRRKEESTDWETGLLQNYFAGATLEKGTFPSDSWAVHTFTPGGKEIIIAGENIYYHDAGQTVWKTSTTREYFKDNAPDGYIMPKPQKKEDDTKTEVKKEEPKTNEKAEWRNGMLFDYFDGQQIKGEENKEEKKENEYSFPIQGYDTHAISLKGTEIITKADKVYARLSTTAKIWEPSILIEYFKDQVVTNALQDAPEEQLPTGKLRTHAYSNDGFEYVTFKDRYWKRKEGDKNWETGLLKDYFTDTTLEKGTLPTSHWDLHTFSPTGREIIVVAESLTYRDIKEKAWKQQTLQEYFGADFPLDKEIDEKRKVEAETDSKKFDIIKDKVMFELRKFFRPELINRFDEVIFFEPFKFEHMMKITKLQLKAVAKLLEDQDMGISFTDSAIKEIAREGFDPVYGARPLRRAIQRVIENPLSTLIIEKKAVAGDTILVDYNGETFLFNVERIEMVDPSTIANEKMKHFLCESCGNQFDTEVEKNATTVCSKCASTKVQPVIVDKPASAEASAGKPDETKNEGKKDEKKDDVDVNTPAEPERQASMPPPSDGTATQPSQSPAQ